MARTGSIAVLVSGGLDSAVLLGEQARDSTHVMPIYVRQGLRWETQELYWVRQFIGHLMFNSLLPLRILSLPMGDVYGRHWSVRGKGVPGPRSKDEAVYLPGRNLALTLKAAVICAHENIHQIALGSLGGNPFADATPKFFKQWSEALSLGLSAPIQVIAPYRKLSKVDVIRRGKDFPLAFSFSCIQPRGRFHCGRCNKCAERSRAFTSAGVPDRTRYALQPLSYS